MTAAVFCVLSAASLALTPRRSSMPRRDWRVNTELEIVSPVRLRPTTSPYPTKTLSRTPSKSAISFNRAE